MLYIVLLHYPVYNKEGKIVTTAIANMDIHDIARLAKTYRSARILHSKSYIGTAEFGTGNYQSLAGRLWSKLQ